MAKRGRPLKITPAMTRHLQAQIDRAVKQGMAIAFKIRDNEKLLRRIRRLIKP